MNFFGMIYSLGINDSINFNNFQIFPQFLEDKHRDVHEQIIAIVAHQSC